MKYVDLWMFIVIRAIFLDAISLLYYTQQKFVLTEFDTWEAR
jgi:hypothetical protein